MDIFEQIANDRRQGRPFVLATIVSKQGSSPRSVGARMIVYTDSTIVGSIGGGIFEKLAIADCLELFDSETPSRLKRYRFTESGEDATGMNCGGEAELLMERIGTLNRLVIFGGGHIGRELVRVTGGLGFIVTIVDDRDEVLKEFAPTVDTLLTDSEYRKALPPLGKNCFVVLVTRSHQTDQAVLEYVVDKECAYVGMIGSKAKIAKLFAAVEASGVERSLLDKVHTPIGLKIGAEGPSEIAVAIAAELIATKNGALQNQ